MEEEAMWPENMKDEITRAFYMKQGVAGNCSGKARKEKKQKKARKQWKAPPISSHFEAFSSLFCILHIEEFDLREWS